MSDAEEQNWIYIANASSVQRGFRLTGSRKMTAIDPKEIFRVTEAQLEACTGLKIFLDVGIFVRVTDDGPAAVPVEEAKANEPVRGVPPTPIPQTETPPSFGTVTGAWTAKLEAAGIASNDDLAECDPETLTAIDGISQQTAISLVSRARAALAAGSGPSPSGAPSEPEAPEVGGDATSPEAEADDGES